MAENDDAWFDQADRFQRDLELEWQARRAAPKCVDCWHYGEGFCFNPDAIAFDSEGEGFAPPAEDFRNAGACGITGRYFIAKAEINPWRREYLIAGIIASIIFFVMVILGIQ